MADAAKSSKTRRKSSAARDEASLKFVVVDAALPRIPTDGFTDGVLKDAAINAGVEKRDVPRLFPQGPLSLVEAFSDKVDREMDERLAKSALTKMKIRERIATAVKTRLDILRPNKDAARRAAAFLTLPPNAPRAATLLYRTVDLMWRAAGDTSTDFNFYSKRAILAGVYTSTLVRWFTDDSEDEAPTQDFLARRVEDVMRFEKFKGEMRERAKHFPSLTDILSGPSRKRS